MSAPRSHDAIVIGGGTSGLIAATYLAKAGKSVLLLEAQDRLGGLCAASNLGEGFSGSRGASTLYALDPLVIRDLKLSRRGLRFAGQELALTGLRSDGKHIVITRNGHDTAASIAAHSRRDAETWLRFRKELFDLARAMRPLWWEAHGRLPSGIEGKRIAHIARMGAAAWLDSWFESEALKTTLCFDAASSGLSILEPGSALSLVWRAAQEMSGLQGAVAVPLGGVGALVDALIAVTRDTGCELRTGACATRLILDDNRVAGVELNSGETCFAPLVVSAVSTALTNAQLLPPAAYGLGRADVSRSATPMAEAMVTLTLGVAPLLAGVPSLSRFIVAEKLESYVSAEMSARSGEVGDELPLEFVVPTRSDETLAPPGQHILCARIRPVPQNPRKSWPVLRSTLTSHVMASLERAMPNFSRTISRVEILTPHDTEAGSFSTVSHMLMGAAERVQTPIGGLFFCGAEAEPVPAISGRAARIATALAVTP